MRTPTSIDSGGHRARALARRDALVEQHLYLVKPIAQHVVKRLPPSFDVDDLIAAGQFGLIRAATRYRPLAHNQTPFDAFARPRIRGAMLDSVRRKNWDENTREPIPEDYEARFDDPFAEHVIIEIDTRNARRKDRHARLRAPLTVALERLTARQRVVLGAYYAENFESVEDAGEALRLTRREIQSEHDDAVGVLRRIMGVQM